MFLEETIGNSTLTRCYRQTNIKTVDDAVAFLKQASQINGIQVNAIGSRYFDDYGDLQTAIYPYVGIIDADVFDDSSVKILMIEVLYFGEPVVIAADPGSRVVYLSINKTDSADYGTLEEELGLL